MSRYRTLLRVAAVLAVVSATIILITGPYPRSAADDEILFAALPAAWATIILTKPRRNT